ncbi:MAG: hypothetical protein C4312_04825, partial [Thermoflexus sp.]
QEGTWRVRGEIPVERWTVLAGWGLMAYRLEREALERWIQRLRFPAREAEVLRAVHALQGELGRWAEPLPPSAVAAALEVYPLVALFVVWLAAPPGRARDHLHRYAQEWR